jgi:hypothetical protein
MWDQIQVNVPIDDARFEQPPARHLSEFEAMYLALMNF